MLNTENIKLLIDSGEGYNVEFKVKIASGIPCMKKAMKEAGLPEPEFNTNGIFTAVFQRQIKNYANYDTKNDIVNDTINKYEQTIIDLLKKTGIKCFSNS